MDKDIKRSIILDNYQNPNNKRVSGTDYIKINTRNVSCIDNLDIYLNNDKIKSKLVLIIIPIKVAFIAILAFPIACNALARGDWIYCIKQIGAKTLKYETPSVVL